MTSLKRSIMLVLSLLVALFIVGMWLMSGLNLGFAERAMSDLRQRQITDTFHANLDRINAHHQLMEQNTSDLARLGELLYQQRMQRHQDNSSELQAGLAKALSDYPDAYAGGLWFQPGAYQTTAYALNGYRSGDGIRIEQSHPLEPPVWSHSSTQGNMHDSRFTWSPAYYREDLNNVVISLSKPMYDAEQNLVGVASTDWRADDIIRLVSRVEITPGTFSFLLDSENRNLSSLSQADDVQYAQNLMDAVIERHLHEQPTTAATDAILSNRQLVTPIQTLQLTVEQADYALFYSRTQAGMIFGIGVPQAEIDAVLAPMRLSNFRIVAIIGTILLILSGLILYMVAGTLRQLNNLYTDALTQLPNREKLLVDLRHGQPATLILLNIDAFKEINDFYGHECGDHVISQLAQALQHLIDTTASWHASRLYRMPGDEMAIWIPGQIAEAELHSQLAGLLQLANKLEVVWEQQEIPLHVSLGVASTRSPDGTPLASEDLLPSASIALKLARLNQNHYLIYDPARRVREAYEHNLIWAGRLKAALDDQRIVPFFQPIMDTRTGEIGKFECLVRMLDEHGNPVNPGEFLPVARKIRLCRQITRRMVEQCFSLFASNQYQFSINLSSEDLQDSELTDFIIEALGNSDIAERVIFEILESDGIDNYTPVRQFIDRVKSLGCQIAIDDFGTGYSNFEHLLKLNVDLIKIDGSLIQHLDRDPSAQTLTRGIVRFARELGIKTVAEFVHSPQVLEQVRQLDIDFAQGACIGMPAAELISRVEMPSKQQDMT